MVKRFTIESLEVEGFRGINSKINYRFDRPIILLFGKNGFGKSSTLGAIEWCLFGDLAYLRFLETPRTRDELVNDHHPDGIARVKVVLRRDGGRYEFTREKELHSGKMKFNLLTPDGEFKDEDAEDRCFNLLGLTFEDFYRAVYLHQESVRGLLTEDPSKRDEAMDRLLGLETLRDIVDNIPVKDVEEKIRELRKEKEIIESRVRGRTQQIESDLRRAKEKARRGGIAEKDITFEFGRETIKSMIDDLTKIAKEYKIEPPEIDLPTSVGDLGKGLGRAKKFLGTWRKAVVEIARMDKLTGERGQLVHLKDELAQNSRKIELTRDRLQQITQKYGEERKIKSKMIKIDDEIRGQESKREEIDAISRLVQDSIDYLEKTIVDTCPVCGSKIQRERLLLELKKRVEGYRRREIQKIDARIKRLEGQKRTLERNLQQLKGLRGELKDHIQQKDQIIRKISDIIGPVEEEKIPKSLSQKIRELTGEIRRLERIYRARERALGAVDRKIEKVRAVHDVLEKKEQFKTLERISEVKEMKVLQNTIQELNTFKERLTEITEVATDVQIGLASEIIEKSSQDISRFYKILCNHPYYGELLIDVKPKKVAGRVKNSYLIKAFHPTEGKGTLVSTRFSTGQMNSVALAIYLAMSRTLAHKLGFLIMDDPSQSLDTPHKEALAKVLKKMSRYCQLIVSTQDIELQKALKSQLISPKGRYIYNFAGWSKNGPRIEIAE